jgi:hypothetical protein
MDSFPVPAQTIRALPANELAPLVSEQAHERIARLADQFAVPSHTVCYECRLEDEVDQVDFAVAVFPLTGAPLLDALARERAIRSESPQWSRCLAFLASWSKGEMGSPWPFACVAFDIDASSISLPVPCLSICVDSDFFARRLGSPGTRPLRADELGAATSLCFQQLNGSPLPSHTRELLSRCATGAEARHVSFMLSRSPATIKVDVEVAVQNLEEFLRQLYRSGEASGIEAEVRDLLPAATHVQLNLVVCPDLMPRLEVEFFAGAAGAGIEGRENFLQKLVKRGLCGDSKARRLEQIWSSPLFETGSVKIARSWYAKVRFEGTTAVDAKAYLALMPRVFGGS